MTQSNALLRELELGTVAKTKYVTQKGAIEASSVQQTPQQRYSGVARRETKYVRVKEKLPSAPYPESTPSPESAPPKSPFHLGVHPCS